jgi:hypothetical protein
MQDPPELIKNRKELVDEMIDKYGYLFCQKCQKSKCGRNFEVHHIVFRSEAPGHPMLHSKQNLIIVGDWCHQYAPNSFHRKKDERIPFMNSRNLYKLFEGFVY